MTDHLRVNLLTADEPTITGRIYPKEVLEHAIERFNAKYGEETPCFCDNNAKPHVDLADVTHQVESFEMEGNELVANIKMLDTPAGKILQKMYNVLGRDRFTIFPAGVGSIKNRKYIADDYDFTGVIIRPTGG